MLLSGAGKVGTTDVCGTLATSGTDVTGSGAEVGSLDSSFSEAAFRLTGAADEVLGAVCNDVESEAEVALDKRLVNTADGAWG